jgi:hypothetical protein
MAKLSPRESVRWYRAAERPSDVVAVSDCYEWASHWDVDAGRTRRCGGAECVLCADGSPVVRRYVFFVRCSMGIVWALELRDGQRRAIEAANRDGSCLGALFRLRLEGRALDCAYMGKDTVTIERPIDAFGESLGLPAIRAAVNCPPEKDRRFGAILEELADRHPY